MNKFLNDSKGNIAIIFAIVLMCVIMVIGSAIDICNIQTNTEKYQRYADSAVLAAEISGETKVEDLNTIVGSMVDENNDTGNKLETELSILKDGTYHVEVSADYNMMIMDIIGIKKTSIKVLAESPAPGTSEKLNLALVLDVTRSMNGEKLETLKQAAKDLVKDISGGVNGESMFSVIPFAQYVKLPLSTASEDWINVQPGGQSCWRQLDKELSVNCRQEWDGETKSTVCEEEIYKQVCKVKSWDGCVGSRRSPWHKRSEYGPSKIQGFTKRDWCHDTMLPLTNNVSEVNETIDKMHALQETYIPAGLVWGWRALTPNAPLIQAHTNDFKIRHSALILMTDGKNSNSLGGTGTNGFGGVYHWGTDTNAADHLTTELCDSIKADNIIIYTVAFEVSDMKTKSMLENCATDSSKYFNARNTELLRKAFSDIGKSHAENIRLSK